MDDATAVVAATTEAIEFLRGRIDSFITVFRRSRNRNRLLTNIFKITSIGVGGILTVLIGFKSAQQPAWIQDYATLLPLPLSALVTSLAAWEAFADHRWKWVQYRSTLHEIYRIRDDLEFAVSKMRVLTNDDLNAFYQQLVRIVDETDQAWLRQRGNDGHGRRNADG
jgi:hypothetical protein